MKSLPTGLTLFLVVFAPAAASVADLPATDAFEHRVVTLGARSFRGDTARFDRRHGHWWTEARAELRAPVNVPDGVAIERLAAGLTIGSPNAGRAECSLVRVAAGGVEAEVLATISIEGSGYHPVDTTHIAGATVDNRRYRYFVVVRLESSPLESPQLLHWIQVEYVPIA